jgi:hydrogenase nickel incorporation protein HypA/HybF
MHELSLATEILRACRSHVPPGGRLRSVTLAVGELSAVEPDLLRFAWQALTGGGPDDGSTLDIEWRPARQTCDACGGIPERAGADWLRLCPRCGGMLQIEGGRELDLLRIAFDEAALPGGG